MLKFFNDPDISISVLIKSDCGVYITDNLSLDMSLESIINDLSILLHCTVVVLLLNKYSVFAPILLHTTSILSIGNTISAIDFVDVIISLSNILINTCVVAPSYSKILIKYSSISGPYFILSLGTSCVFGSYQIVVFSYLKFFSIANPALVYDCFCVGGGEYDILV